MRAISTLLFGITLASSVHAQPDLSGFWSPQVQRQDSGDVAAGKIPEGAVFIDDAGAGELAEGDFSGLRLTERAKAEVRDYDFASEFDRENTCIAPSVAFYMQAPFPIEIHQADQLIAMKIEYFDLYRLIFLDGREIPADAPLSKSGYSVGHWEGNELVVDTARIASATFMNNGFNHSNEMKLTERFTLSEDGQTLSLIQVYEDPETFDGVAARQMAWRKRDGEYVFPYECDPSFGN
jgi:hypothetical protein